MTKLSCLSRTQAYRYCSNAGVHWALNDIESYPSTYQK